MNLHSGSDFYKTMHFTQQEQHAKKVREQTTRKSDSSVSLPESRQDKVLFVSTFEFLTSQKYIKYASRLASTSQTDT